MSEPPDRPQATEARRWQAHAQGDMVSARYQAGATGAEWGLKLRAVCVVSAATGNPAGHATRHKSVDLPTRPSTPAVHSREPHQRVPTEEPQPSDAFTWSWTQT